jgi:phage gpG-like protein
MTAVNLDVKSLKGLDKIPDKMFDGLFKGMKQAIVLAEKTAKEVYLSGKALKKRSGKLSGTVKSEARRKGKDVEGVLSAGGASVPYAGIHEFGGKLPGRSIMPTRARVLRYTTRTGRLIFTASAEVPPTVVKASPFLRPSIKDNMAQMLDILERSTTKETNK